MGYDEALDLMDRLIDQTQASGSDHKQLAAAVQGLRGAVGRAKEFDEFQAAQAAKEADNAQGN